MEGKGEVEREGGDAVVQRQRGRKEGELGKGNVIHSSFATATAKGFWGWIWERGCLQRLG